MRSANSIDFWRGVALVTIFLNHVPGLFYERFTHRNYGFSDSAELFVFLAGWSVKMAAGEGGIKLETQRLALRLAARGVTLYAAQILITMVALAAIAATALVTDNPAYLEWHNAASVFQDPVSTHVGLVLLTHQLGYFDILPLYVVLMLMAPLLVIMDAVAPRLVLPLSFAVYLGALVLQINLPTWPVEGRWFFNPFAWQFIFVLGFVLARSEGPMRQVEALVAWLRPLSWIVLAIGLYCVASALSPDPLSVPEPRLLFIVDKTYLSPIRLIHFLMLLIAFAPLYPALSRMSARLCRFLSMLGRNSLHVFCIGSLLSLIAQLIRSAFEPSLAIDTILVCSGVAIMGAAAWLCELRQRLSRAA
jgi:hypothetical protein